MFSKAPFFLGVDGRVIGPRPAAKLGALIVGKGLLKLFTGIHDKRAIVRYRLLDWTTFE